jgi:iron complex outermembrane recepter protein
VTAGIYSLGYDLNAFGNRFYNSAPKSNYWLGVKLGWEWARKKKS